MDTEIYTSGSAIQTWRGKSPWHVQVWRFYFEGFRNLSPLGRRLWLLILIKLFLFFVVLKIFFFPDLLSRDYDNDTDRAQAVRTHLSRTVNNDDNP